MKKQTLQSTVQNLLAFVQPDQDAKPSHYAQVMRPFQERGLATAKQIARMTGLDYKRAAEALVTLSQPSYDRPAALRSALVRLEGLRGPSEKLFLLTDEGAAMAQILFECPNLRAPQLVDVVELTAAYAMMEVYSRARAAGYTAYVEQPLYFGNGKTNVRADVVIEVGDRLLIFEIEQASNQGTLPRAVDKLARLHNLFLAPATGNKVSNQVRMLFNLSQNDQQTIPVWQQAQRDVLNESGGTLSFQLYGQRLNEFLEHPDWEGLEGFERIEPTPARLTTPPQASPSQPAGKNLLLAVHGAKEVDEMRAVMLARERVYGEQMRRVHQQSDHALRVEAFFEIMLLIYGASHYRNSPVNKYAALPTESLEMMNRYLHDQQNAAMLEDLHNILQWIHEHNTGIMSLRYGFTAMIWDSFLFHHGFGRSDALRVNVRFPDFADQRSDIYVEVRIGQDMLSNPRPTVHIGIWDKKLEEIALAWVLESMILYPHMIGLGKKPWMAQQIKSYRKKR